MSWTWSVIRRDWPGVDDLAYEEAAIVHAFNRREELLGSPLSETIRPQPGTYAPLTIVCDGRRLSALDGVPHVDRFVSRLKRSDAAAWAELEGMYILRSGADETEAEIDPQVNVGRRTRLADSRIRRTGDGVWTYVEVSRPGESLSRTLVGEYLRSYSENLGPGDKRGVSLVLRRRPTGDELPGLLAFIASARERSEPMRLDLPNDLGSLVVEAERTTAPHGVAMIKWVVPDPRGVNLVRREAPQLPEGSPAIVMLDVSMTLVDWSQSLRAYLAEGRHRWVSAVCLFTSSFAPSPRGEGWAISVRLVENPHPIVSLPTWIGDVLRRFIPSGFDGD